MAQHSAQTVKKGGQRKLAALLAAFAWLWVQSAGALAEVENTVTVTGTSTLDGSAVTTQASEQVDVEDANPELTLVKTGTPDFSVVGSPTLPNVGDAISYTFEVTNSGNITIDNVTLTDPGVTLVGGAIGTLAPGASVTATGSYTITQIDIDAGLKNNTAEVTGDPVTGGSLTVSDSESIALPNAPAITLDKIGSLDLGGDGVPTAGDLITYSFRVENAGATTLANVTILDPLATVAGGPIAAMLPGDVDTTTFTATYAITQNDIDAGEFINTAQVRGTAGAALITATDSFTVPITAASSMTFDKQVAATNFGGDGIANAGETISYDFVVTNTGQTTIRNVTIADPQVARLNTVSEPAIAVLDALRNGVDPIVTATTGQAAPPPAPAVAGNTAPPLYHNLSVIRRLVLLSGDPKQLMPGDRIGILHDVVNTGDGPLTAITLQQTSGEVFNERIDILAPGASDDSSFVLVHELTLDEIVRAEVNANAVLTAKARTQELRIVADAALPLSAIEGYEALATAVITPANFASLAPGDSTTFNGTYVLTQADIDAGSFTNTAEAQGEAGTPSSPVISPPDSETVPLPAVPAIAVVKTAVAIFGIGNIPNVGETITYTFRVTNTGNVSLGSVSVTDPLPGMSAPALQSGDANGNTRLDTSETWIYTATYAVTQDDIDAGEVRNQARAEGSPPVGLPVGDDSDDDSPLENEETVVPLTPQPRIALVKTAGTIVDANASTLIDVGDTIEYTFTVTNPGNVSLGAVAITDPLPALPVPVLQSGDADNDGAIDATETWVFTSTYTLVQTDIDAGEVQNQATVSGTPPVGVPATDLSDNDNPTQNDPTVVPVTQTPRLAVVKTETPFSDANGDGLVNKDGPVGDTINYTIRVTNTGTVTLAPITLTDPNAVLASNTIASLAPGAFADVTATHVVTDADMRRRPRQVSNQARATSGAATDLSDESDITGNDPTITPLRVVSVAIVKPQPQVIDTVADGQTGEGDTLRYTFAIENTGTEALSNIVVSELLVTGTQTGSIPGLTPGQIDNTSITFDYVITAADMVAGTVTNQARVTAQGGPNATPVEDDSDNNSPTENDPTVTLVGTPEIALIKRAGTPRDVNGSGRTDVGDVIDYTFEVTNTGGVPLTNVRITDAKVGAIAGSPIASLAVGASDTSLTASYEITQADVNRGFVENQATARANSIRGPVEDLSDDAVNDEDDPTRTNLAQDPAIALIKTITSVTDTNANGINDPGDIINYAFAVTNTGNVTLTDVRVEDDNADVRGGPLRRLLPGATDSTTFTATHRVTGEDAVAGRVLNSAEALGFAFGPRRVIVSDISDSASLNGDRPTVITVFLAPPTVTKTAGRSEIRRGESVTYTIIANGLTGFRTAIRDVMPGSFIFNEGSATANGQRITPQQNGRVLTFTGYQPDIDGRVEIKLRLTAGATLTSGEFVNTAQVINRDNGEVIAEATATVEIEPEHVFDCGDVIGRVFDDQNGNGYYDDGEPGLPAVNVITVGGLIVTTDELGRYHVACAMLPTVGIGSTFIMKLDPATLPTGYSLTSENPRDVRLTRGKVTKLNFGAKRSCDVRLDLRKDAFVTDSVKLKPKWSDGLGRLSSVLQNCPGKLEVVYTCGKPHPIIDGRLQSIEAAIRQRWEADGAPYDLDITSRSECSK